MLRKDFSSAKVREKGLATREKELLVDLTDIPSNRVIKFPKSSSVSLRNFDMAKYYGLGFDELTHAVQITINNLLKAHEATKGESLSVNTIKGYCSGGLIYFFPFLSFIRKTENRDIELGSIDSDTVDKLIIYLEGLDLTAYSQKNAYAKIKAILTEMGRQGFLGDNYHQLFPKNPYPGVVRTLNKSSPYSKAEMGRVSRAIKNELKRIVRGRGPLDGYDLGVCYFAIALRTGINATPLVELQEGCLQDHPLKDNRKLLVSFKRRGKSTHAVSVRKTESITEISSVMLDVSSIIELIIERNKKIRNDLKTGSIFAYVPSGKLNQQTTLSVSTVKRLSHEIVKRNEITSDNGDHIKLNVDRLRKTFINRIWELSGQDPLVTAAMGGHGLKVSNDHYLEAPPEAERNFSLLGEILVKDALESPVEGLENTPIAKCVDTKNGHRAPKNGSYCTSFLACFRCKSFVVTSDDLYRLLSLYFLLIKERAVIGSKRWSTHYSHIIRVIDNEIINKFDPELVRVNRQKARLEPHPYWKNRDVLEVEGVDA